MEYSLLTYVYNLRTPLLSTIMLAITTLSQYQWGAVVVVIAAIAMAQKNRRISLIFVCSVLASCLINYLLKNIFQVPRPNIMPMENLHDFSFPSGHAMNNLVLYGSLAIITRNKLVWIWTILWVLLIGASRIYLGSHYVVDVIAGYVLGSVILLLVRKYLSQEKLRD